MRRTQPDAKGSVEGKVKKEEDTQTYIKSTENDEIKKNTEEMEQTTDTLQEDRKTARQVETERAANLEHKKKKMILIQWRLSKKKLANGRRDNKK